jgi:hypothetical protein
MFPRTSATFALLAHGFDDSTVPTVPQTQGVAKIFLATWQGITG